MQFVWVVERLVASKWWPFSVIHLQSEAYVDGDGNIGLEELAEQDLEQLKQEFPTYRFRVHKYVPEEKE